MTAARGAGDSPGERRGDQGLPAGHDRLGEVGEPRARSSESITAAFITHASRRGHPAESYRTRTRRTFFNPPRPRRPAASAHRRLAHRPRRFGACGPTTGRSGLCYPNLQAGTERADPAQLRPLLPRSSAVTRYADERARRRRSLRQALVPRSNGEELIFHDEVRDRSGRRHSPSWRRGRGARRTSHAGSGASSLAAAVAPLPGSTPR